MTGNSSQEGATRPEDKQSRCVAEVDTAWTAGKGLELHRLACLSTCHVTREVAAELDRICDPSFGADPGNSESWQRLIVAARWQDYGWWVWVPSDGRDLMPQPLRACLRLAEAAGAAWVQFDRDVAPIDELATFDW